MSMLERKKTGKGLFLIPRAYEFAMAYWGKLSVLLAHVTIWFHNTLLIWVKHFSIQGTLTMDFFFLMCMDFERKKERKKERKRPPSSLYSLQCTEPAAPTKSWNVEKQLKWLERGHQQNKQYLYSFEKRGVWTTRQNQTKTKSDHEYCHCQWLWVSDSPYHNPREEENINIPRERRCFYGKPKNFSA